MENMFDGIIYVLLFFAVVLVLGTIAAWEALKWLLSHLTIGWA
jgi:hypothetical protein